MAKITAADVNKLRKSTGAGMKDCRKDLVEGEGDVDEAVAILRKKGQQSAAKRADRESSEGVAIAKVNDEHTKGIIVSLNCETDFVAKNDGFIKLAEQLAELALEVDSLEELMKADFEGITVEEKLLEQTGVIGEKIEIGAFEILEAPYVGHYIHAGNKIATLTGVSEKGENTEEIAKDVAMQVAAMNPIALDEEGVPQDIIDKELEYANEQNKKEGKPEHLWEQISKGRLKRFFKDNTLINQEYIKDSKITVGKHVQKLGDDVKVTGFKRVELG